MRAWVKSPWGLTLLLAAVLLAALGYLQYRLWHGTGGLVMVDELNAKVTAQREENERLRQRNAALAAEVMDLKSGDVAIEERARSELGMVKPDEIFYRIVDPEHVLDAAPPADAAQ